jgi:hypothetical protein
MEYTTQKCLHCGRDILASHSGTLYCTYACKEKAYIKRRRARDEQRRAAEAGLLPPNGGTLSRKANFSPQQLENLKLKKDPLDEL